MATARLLRDWPYSAHPNIGKTQLADSPMQEAVGCLSLSAAYNVTQPADFVFAHTAGRRERLQARTTKSMTMLDAANNSAYQLFPTLPNRCNTVRGEVLADLFTGKRLRSLDTVFASNTTRLAAVIHILGDTRGGKYGWPIHRCDVDVETIDGRTASVTEYWLSDDAINHGLLIGSAEFCSDVRDARALARAHAAASR